MKEVSVLKASTEEGGSSVAMRNTKSKNNIVSPLSIEMGTLLKTDTPLAADQLPISIEEGFPGEPNIKSGIWMFFKAIRLHQWTKNLLVFAPLLLSSTLTPSSFLFSVGLAFLALSLCASSVYLLNDLAALEWDVPILTGVFSVLLLLSGSIVLSLFLPLGSLLVLATYFILNLAYSFYLKQNIWVEALLDLTCVIAGALAAQITISPWLLAFSLFLFLGLAFAKHCLIWLILLWAWDLF